MPSPFNRFPANMSKNPPKDRAIEPTPESYEGYNNPYRGTEMHGVEPTDDPRPVPGYGSGRTVEYDPPLPEPEPIPVVVVHTGARELRRSRIYQSSANVGAPTQIVGRDESRILVKLKNLGASVVWIGHDDNIANAQHGWPLAENETYESPTQDTLYALSSHVSDPMNVSVTVVYGAEL